LKKTPGQNFSRTLLGPDQLLSWEDLVRLQEPERRKRMKLDPCPFCGSVDLSTLPEKPAKQKHWVVSALVVE
jgi:hypothetical protein